MQTNNPSRVFNTFLVTQSREHYPRNVSVSSTKIVEREDREKKFLSSFSYSPPVILAALTVSSYFLSYKLAKVEF